MKKEVIEPDEERVMEGIPAEILLNQMVTRSSDLYKQQEAGVGIGIGGIGTGIGIGVGVGMGMGMMVDSVAMNNMPNLVNMNLIRPNSFSSSGNNISGYFEKSQS